MNGTVPGRVSAVFAGLIVATCVTWWLGSGSSSAGNEFELVATLTLVIAFVKVYLIGMEFMELRGAPSLLRSVFTIWVSAVAAAAVAMVVV